MATHRFPEGTRSPADDKTLELIQQIVDKNYGLKLVPKNYTCENCDTLKKEKSDLQQFISEISHVVNFLHDPRIHNPDHLISLDFQQKLKSHLENTMSDYSRLQQFFKKPLILEDLVTLTTSSPESPCTSANSTVAPTQSTGGPPGKKRKNSECRQDRISVFQRTLQYIELGEFKVSFHNLSDGQGEGILKGFPENAVVPVPIVGRLQPDMLWEYMNQVKMNKSEDVLTFMLTPGTPQDGQVYMSVFWYLKGKERVGVLGGFGPPLKDAYLVPLGKREVVPTCLSLNGRGLPEDRGDCLLAVVVHN